jgi:hypothetical protein
LAGRQCRGRKKAEVIPYAEVQLGGGEGQMFSIFFRQNYTHAMLRWHEKMPNFLENFLQLHFSDVHKIKKELV